MNAVTAVCAAQYTTVSSRFGSEDCKQSIRTKKATPKGDTELSPQPAGRVLYLRSPHAKSAPDLDPRILAGLNSLERS